MDRRIFNTCTGVNECDCTRGYMDTVRESALKVGSGRKIPCCTEELNLHWQHAGLMLYQLSYIPTQNTHTHTDTHTNKGVSGCSVHLPFFFPPQDKMLPKTWIFFFGFLPNDFTMIIWHKEQFPFATFSTFHHCWWKHLSVPVSSAILVHHSTNTSNQGWLVHR